MKGEEYVFAAVEYINIKSPKKKESEDAYLINHKANIFGVFDGSTPLTDFKDEAGHNGAYLAANLFRDYFGSLPNAENRSLVQSVIRANDLLRKKMEDYQVVSTSKEHLWSTCVALVQIKPMVLEYVQLGDSMIIAGFKDGRINVLTKDTVKGISDRAREKRVRDRQNGLDVPEEGYYSDLRNALIYNRSMANIPEGYSVANGMQEVKEFIQHGQLTLDGVDSILMITDGLFFPEKNLEYSFERVKEVGLQQYSEELLEVQKANKLKIDDKAGVFIRF